MQDPVVFLPGVMCDARVFAPQWAALSPHRAVTLAPVTDGERIEEIASRLLDVLPWKFAMAGVSMGGIVAMEILRRAPDRVTRVALMDTNPLAETPESAANYEPVIIKLKAGLIEDAVAAMLGPDVLAPGQTRAGVMALVTDMAKHLGADTIIAQIRAVQRRRDYQATLRRCKVPALLLCGEHDRLTPVKRHAFMAELMPNARLEVIEAAGHLPMLEKPNAVTAAVRQWLVQPLVTQNAVSA